MPGLWQGHSSPIRGTIRRMLRGLPDGRQCGCFVSANRTATRTSAIIARTLPGCCANRCADICQRCVRCFPAWADNSASFRKRERPENVLHDGVDATMGNASAPILSDCIGARQSDKRFSATVDRTNPSVVGEDHIPIDVLGRGIRAVRQTEAHTDIPC